MLLINCEVHFISTWSSTNSTGAAKFDITDTKLYVSVVALSYQDNTKLLEQLDSGSKREVNWSKYLSKRELSG